MQKIKKSIKVFRKNVGFIVLILLFGNCNQAKTNIPNNNVRDVLLAKTRLDNYNKNIYPTLLKTIKTGDIITRLGSDLTSTLLAKINLHDKSYSHVGIASLENDTVFIYHALGGEFNPSQKLRRETLWSFAHPDDNKRIGIFRFNLTLKEIIALQKTAQHCYKKEILFDMDFDLKTDDKLYCAEFVAKSLDMVKGNKHYIPISHISAKDFIGVDDITMQKDAIKIIELSY